MGILKKFLKDERGNFAVIFAIATLPVMASVAVAVDYSNLARLRFNLSDAVDSTCSVVARAYLAGGTNEDVKAAGVRFFDVNIDPIYAASSAATFIFPNTPGNTTKELKCTGTLTYNPLFAPLMAKLMNKDANDYVTIIQNSTMQMSNVAEIALVLDNSGSMAYNNLDTYESNVSLQRMSLLKTAAKKLVTDLITAGAQIQSGHAVKFSIVPFAASVNVGQANISESWMDTRGISPVHHEHLDWGTPSPTNPSGYVSTAPDGAKLDAAGVPLSRFTIFSALKVRSGGSDGNTRCTVWAAKQSSNVGPTTTNCAVPRRSGTLTESHPEQTVTPITGVKYNWAGCVEARPNGMDLNDTAPTSGNPASLFVPMFAPDSFNVSSHYSAASSNMYSYNYARGSNDWWPDYEPGRDAVTGTVGWDWPSNGASQVVTVDGQNTSWVNTVSRLRETSVLKYLKVKPYMAASSSGRQGWMNYYYYPQQQADGILGGPNSGCTTNAITPLTGDNAALNTAIDNMQPLGGTNSAEGLAWGYRTLTPAAPFTGGTPLANKGLDRVVILLTDGANQIGQLGAGGTSLSPFQDYTKSQSGYGPYGVSGYTVGSLTTNKPALLNTDAASSRIFSSISTTGANFSTPAYQIGVDRRMDTICTNIKNGNMILMTVSLDINVNTGTAEQRASKVAAIAALKACAGSSKNKVNADGTPVKLFWNTTSSTLDETFKEIADELSNLRFTQ